MAINILYHEKALFSNNFKVIYEIDGVKKITLYSNIDDKKFTNEEFINFISY